MKKLTSALLGLMTPLLLVQTAEAKTLYERIKSTIEKEVATEKIDEDIAEYIVEFYKDEWSLTTDDVHKIVSGDGNAVCGSKKLDEAGKTLPDCNQMIKAVTQMALDEKTIRSLAREMLATATSYELPLSDLPGRSLKLSADLRGILSIWSAGVGAVKKEEEGEKNEKETPSTLHTISADPEIFGELLKKIGEELEKLPADEQVAAVWRYQYGVRLVDGQREPRFPRPEERGIVYVDDEDWPLFKRWDDLESAIWEMGFATGREIQKIEADLTDDDVVYFVFSEDLLKENLPDNVLVWARREKSVNGTWNPNQFTDFGLQWETPLEPVFPSLWRRDRGIAYAGSYPYEPVKTEDGEQVPMDGNGLCTSPTPMRGYLCRPYVAVAPEERCPEPKDLPPGEISLIHCTTTGSLRFTAAGPDVCREVRWKTPVLFDANTQCQLEMSCASDGCTVGAETATSYAKDAVGKIRNCFRDTSDDIQMTYLVYHELVHSYQKCSLPPGSNEYEKAPANAKRQVKDDIKAHNTALCCRLEGEAYRAQCDMMERDGVFDGEGPIDGIPLNAETCAEAWTHISCSTQAGFNGCYMSRDYTGDFWLALIKASGKNPKNLPSTCSDAIDPDLMDSRVKEFKEAIEGREDVCRPGEQTTYTNRIGNNLCYIGQCVEQSTELHRMTPGRTAAGVVDEVAPWDSPVAGSPLANLLLNPPLSQGSLPAYHPELLVRESEIALCQLQGLPPLTPPVLCIASANRQLEQPSVSGLQIAYNLVQQTREQELSTADFLRLSPALGARAGTALYADYMREANRSFAGILDMAAQMLTEIKDIEFPTEMCPVGPGLPSLPAE